MEPTNIPSLDEFIQIYDINHLVPSNFLELLKESIPTCGTRVTTNNIDPRYSKFIYYFEENKLHTDIHQYMWSITNYIIDEYSKMFYTFCSGAGIKEFCPMQKMFNDEGYFLYVYTEKDFCDIHVDQNRRHSRDISFIIILNDDYEGGNIEFYCGKHLLKSVRPRKNSVVVFPSNFLYAHRVTPVQNGLRYVVVYWVRLD